MQPHFVNAGGLAAMQAATAGLDSAAALAVYDRFCAAREAAIVSRIPVACGVSITVG